MKYPRKLSESRSPFFAVSLLGARPLSTVALLIADFWPLLKSINVSHALLLSPTFAILSSNGRLMITPDVATLRCCISHLQKTVLLQANNILSPPRAPCYRVTWDPVQTPGFKIRIDFVDVVLTLLSIAPSCCTCNRNPLQVFILKIGVL